MVVGRSVGSEGAEFLLGDIADHCTATQTIPSTPDRS